MPKKRLRTYLALPRGARTPSPRILVLAGVEGDGEQRATGLARCLAEEFPKGSVVLATGSSALAAGTVDGLEVVKLPLLTVELPVRPLARDRARRLRGKLLATLVDVFRPDLLLVDRRGSESRREAEALAPRAEALGTVVLGDPGHAAEPPGCDASTATPCAECRAEVGSAVRFALARR